MKRTYGYYPLVLEKGMKHHEFQDSGYVGGWGFAITKSCNAPERAVKFFDWLCTEESNILRNWGIEGLHYDIINGKRVWKDEVKKAYISDTQFSKKTGIGKYLYPFPFYGNNTIDSNGQSYSPTGTLEAIIENQSSIENDILSKYGIKCWKDFYPPKSEFKVKPYGVMYLLPIEDNDIKAKEQKSSSFWLSNDSCRRAKLRRFFDKNLAALFKSDRRCCDYLKLQQHTRKH